MKKDQFRVLSFIIILVVLVTIMIQGYWNYRNYQVNKQHFLSDVQVALDNGVETYYANLAKRRVITLTGDSLNHFRVRDSLVGQANAIVLTYDQQFQSPLDSLKMDTISIIDTVVQHRTQRILVKQQQRIRGADFNDLTAKILISLQSDKMDTARLRSLIGWELERKDLDLEYLLIYHTSVEESENKKKTSDGTLLTAKANPSYLPPGTIVEILFPNSSFEILKRGIVGLAISLLTAMAIIAVLFYLYRIIRDQKELARMKDDLISNITHEFKTPIATVSSALEGIQRFNQDDDKEKTNRYLNISATQLKKLDGMVEKLLETATIDHDQIVLRIEETNVSYILASLSDRYSIVKDGPTLKVNIEADVYGKVDPFHFENAISNLIDNAIKYGGEQIEVGLKKVDHNFEVKVRDNGKGIDRSHQMKIFGKFYRIPTGNQHDVKGYGIGLYYSKKIIEKHGGRISLHSGPGFTEFRTLI